MTNRRFFPAEQLSQPASQSATTISHCQRHQLLPSHLKYFSSSLVLLFAFTSSSTHHITSQRNAKHRAIHRLHTMAFTMRQPLKLTSVLAGASKSAFRSAPVRAFHSSRQAGANTFFTAQTTATTRSSALSKARNAFRQGRTYMQQPAVAPNNANLVQKLIVGGAMVGGTWLAIQMIFNRETREDGGMPPFERAYLNDTFMHTGLGVGIIGLSARAMFQSGFTYRLMATNPWVVMIGGLGLSIGTMMATRATNPDK
jgi:hypothetical protein